ncbi:hypothetical protein Franean1_3107 [Parafrankia sp. EAN1pec]|uniref:glycosyltransferase family 2 protein n=1 Tax=Parafrankia sp. (strain EAN1pec) TaxID=298653 RepID=UPI0000541726|nr:hypothetical protein Franean1_3107 [Frankia sp. EAN1pec]
MSIAVLVMTDGRDEHLDRAVQSARWHLGGPITEWFMHDDSGDDDHRAQLATRYPQFVQLGIGPRRGFGGAISWAWSVLTINRALDFAFYLEDDFVFHLEDDFIFHQPVDLGAMADVLTSRPHLAQLALRRQPWNDAERAAGGIVEQHPDDYVEQTDEDGNAWLEHRRFFTTNPCLYPRELCSAGWPAGPDSEGRFGLRLLERGLPWGVSGADVRMGFWGARDSGEWVEHIGHQRAGTGY